MLELILDKAFVNNFPDSYKGDVECIDDFQGYFIRNLRNVKLVTNYVDLEDILNHAKTNPILRRILQSIPQIDFRSNLLTQIDSPTFPVTGSPFKMILSGEDTATCTRQRKQYGLEYLNPAILSERWKLYFSQRTDTCRKTTNDSEIPSEFKFDSWKKFQNFTHPLNAIIITDFYLLAWKRKDEFEKNLKCNILPLLENLMSEASEDIPVEIIIVTEINTSIPTPSQPEKLLYSQKMIVDSLKLKTRKKFNLSIIHHNQKYYPRDFEAFHDRSVITNYFYIESGKGFNIFKDSGINPRIDFNTEIKFRFIFNPQNIYTAFKDLKNLSQYSNRIKNDSGSYSDLLFYPEKSNRLLNN